MRLSWKKFRKVLYKIGIVCSIILICANNTISFASSFFTVTYHANGATSGTVPVDSFYYEAGTEVIVKGSGDLQKASGVFVGWNTAADGSGTTYQEGDAFQINGDTQLYAQWGIISDIHYAYMAGYTDGSFGPNGAITRAEVAQLLYNLNDIGEKIPVLTNGGTSKAFSDVKGGAWYYNAIMLLSEYGIVSGYEDGSYLPGENITRAEFAAMIVLAAGVTQSNAGDSLFSDVQNEHWALSFINTCKEKDYVVGYEDGTFRPGNNITRAEVVTIVNKFLGRSGEVQFNSDKFPDVDSNHWAYSSIMEAGVTHGYYFNSDGEEVWLAVYSVTYDGNGATGGEVPEDKNVYAVGMKAKAAAPGSLSREGYEFSSWNTSADGSGTSHAAGDEFFPGESNVTLYAQWETETDHSKEIIYVSSCPPITVAYNTPAAELNLLRWIEVTLKSGEVAVLEVEWLTDAYDGAVAGTYTLKGDLVLPADGSVLNSSGYQAGVEVTVEEKQDSGNGNNGNGENGNDDNGGKEQEIIYYTVSFDTGGGSAIDSVQVKHGERVTQPADPTRMGYTFNGWYLGLDPYDFNDTIVRDITLVANWTLKGYTVTFDTDGGSDIEEVIVQHGETVSQPEEPEKTGYTFTGWYDGSNVLYNFLTPVTEDITLYAGWNINRYSVTYYRNGAAGTAPMDRNVYTHGETVQVVFTHSMSNGADLFLGWSTASDAAEPEYTAEGTAEFVITEDTDLYAVWATVVAQVNGTDYYTLNEALQAAGPNSTIYLIKSTSLDGEFTSAAGVTLDLKESVTLRLKADSRLAIGAITCGQGASLVNDGVIIGKVSADFVTEIAQDGFGCYKGEGVVFSSYERYTGADNGVQVLGVSAQSSGAVSGYDGGLLNISGDVAVSVNSKNGSADTDHWVTIEYMVPGGTVSVSTSYATYQNGVLASDFYEGSNTIIGTYTKEELKNSQYLRIDNRVQCYLTDGYVLYCPTLYTLADGNTYMELFQVKYSGVNLNRYLVIDTAEGRLYLQSGVYTVPANHTFTIAAGSSVSCDNIDIRNNRVETSIEGVDDTSTLTAKAGSYIYFYNQAVNNFYDSTKIQLNADASGGLFFKSDTQFWWDSSIKGWVKR